MLSSNLFFKLIIDSQTKIITGIGLKYSRFMQHVTLYPILPATDLFILLQINFLSEIPPKISVFLATSNASELLAGGVCWTNTNNC